MFHPVRLSLFQLFFPPLTYYYLFLINVALQVVHKPWRGIQMLIFPHVFPWIWTKQSFWYWSLRSFFFFFLNPESKLSENLADRVCGASYKFCWATCCAFPSFEQQGWTRSPEVPFPDSVLTNLQEKVGVVFCKDRPAENKSELVLWAWGLCYLMLRRKSCTLSRSQASGFHKDLHWRVWSCWRQLSQISHL